MQFLEELHTNLRKISRNFKENFTQFLREFHSIKKNFSQFSRESDSIFSRFSQNFKINFTYIL